MTYDRKAQLRKLHEERKSRTHGATIKAIDTLSQQGKAITFSSVAEEAGLTTSTLYSNPELRKRIEQARQARIATTTSKEDKSSADSILVRSLRRTIKKLKEENQQLRQQVSVLQQKKWEKL